MIDPVSLGFVAAGIAVGNFAESFGSRLAARWIPSSFDQAAWANVALRRKELESQELRARNSIAAARQLKMDELAMTARIRREENDRADHFRHWPLGIRPTSFLTTSQAAGGAALNIILAIVGTGDSDYYRGAGKSLNDALDLVGGYPVHAARCALAGFRDDVIFYHETLKSSPLSGAGLRSTLWNMLHTEPTVLVEMNIPKPDLYAFSLSHWGGAFEAQDPWVTHESIILDLQKVPAEYTARREEIIAMSLLGTLVSLGDAYRALRRPHLLSAPVLPSIMRKTPGVESAAEAVWAPLTGQYLRTYDQVAMHSPMLASELAARAALEAHESDTPAFAEALLGKAFVQYRAAVNRGGGLPEGAILAALHRARGQGGAQTALEKAIRTIHGAVVENPAEGTGNIAESARLFGSRAQKK